MDDERAALLEAIRQTASGLGGARLTQQQFIAKSTFKHTDIFRHFPRWSEALGAAGFAFEPYNQRLDAEELLSDRGQLVRAKGRIPTRKEYKLEGAYSATIFDRKFGA